jgi:hypothetical protein
MPQPKIFNAATGMLCHGAAITDPSGGATVDTQARAATASMLAALRTAGVIAGAVAMPVSTIYDHPRRNQALTPAIADPTGGTTTDSQARAAITSILAVLRSVAFVAGGSADPAFALNQPTMQLCAGAAIADPSGGATIDAECRAALVSALAAMRSYGLIAGATA